MAFYPPENQTFGYFFVFVWSGRDRLVPGMFWRVLSRDLNGINVLFSELVLWIITINILHNKSRNAVLMAIVETKLS